MPANAERIQSGVYRAIWQGNMQIQEIIDNRDRIDSLADEDGVSDYIIIIDAGKAKRMPFDVRGYVRAVSPRTKHILGLNAPFSGEIVGRMVSKMMNMSIELFTDEDKAIARADELLVTLETT